jgi:short subunit dehydrogenase-like uncharacterized protein
MPDEDTVPSDANIAALEEPLQSDAADDAINTDMVTMPSA